MLYDRWRQIARERTAEIALREFPSGRRWSFGELAAFVERMSPCGGDFAFAQGHGAEFVFEVLRAWRDQTLLCPLEKGQPVPVLPMPSLPAVHLKLTSATTGLSRAVIFTEDQLAADAENIVSTMGLRADWPNLGAISLAHSYGFSNLVLPLLLHGIPLVIIEAPLPEMIRMAGQGMPALTLAAVPALWRMWHEAGAVPLQTRLAISAGAPLSSVLEREVHSSCGVKIHNFYGSSECGGIAYDRTEGPRDDDTHAGSPMANVLLIVDERGCLRVAGRAVGRGYWPEEDDALRNGVFQTSDLCELRDGLVFLRGRLGDQINVAGRKILPANIERVLAAHPAVRECVVLGLPSTDASRSETIAVAVVVRDTVSVAELKNFLLARLPAWQVPREWRFADSLSESQRGKISRIEWRRRFLSLE
jgi:long-chain acyl-CoA synthetase